MNFNETVIFLVFFVALYNVIQYLQTRWKIEANRQDIRNLRLEWLYFFLVFLMSLGFSVCSIVYAYLRFSEIYSIGSALTAAIFFIVCGVILLRKMYAAFCALKGRKRSE